MSVLNIKKYPDSVLRKKAKEIHKVTPEIKELGFSMVKTMEENQGAGLAAPQIGESKRIIAVKTEKEPKVFINPKIFKRSRKTEIAEEGCLSVPGVFLKIKRAKETEVEALDLNGKKIQIKAKGLSARIFQHEIDHLDGILFFERLPFWQKLRFKHRVPRSGTKVEKRTQSSLTSRVLRNGTKVKKRM